MTNGNWPNEKYPVATVVITYVHVILVHGENLTFGSHLQSPIKMRESGKQEKETDRPTEKGRVQRPTDNQTDRETDTDRKTEKQAQTVGETDKQRARQGDTGTDKDKQTQEPTGTNTDIQRGEQSKGPTQNYREADRVKHRERNIEIQTDSQRERKSQRHKRDI